MSKTRKETSKFVKFRLNQSAMSWNRVDRHHVVNCEWIEQGALIRPHLSCRAWARYQGQCLMTPTINTCVDGFEESVKVFVDKGTPVYAMTQNILASKHV